MDPLSILVHDLIVRWKRLFRNRANIVWAIAIPLVIVSIVGYILPNDDGIAAVYVQNKDGSLYSQMAVAMLVSDYSATVIDRYADTQTAIDDIDARYPNQTRIIIILPENFGDYVVKYNSGEEFRVQLTDNGLSFVMDTVKTMDEDYDDGTVHLTIHTGTGSNLIARMFKTLNNNLVKQVSPGLTVTLILLVVSGFTVVVMRDERDHRMDVIMRNTRYNRGIQMVSMIIWALLPSAIVLVSSYIALRLNLDFTFDVNVIAVLILSSTFAVTYGMLISELVRNGQAVFVANTSILFAMLLLCGGIFPKEMLSQRILDASPYVPVSHLIDMMACSMGYGGDFMHSLLMATLFIAGMIVAWYALVRYRERGM